MKILHLSAYDTGGAGSLAVSLHRQLRAHGADSRFFVLDNRSGATDITAIGAGGLRGWLEITAGKVWSRLYSDANHYFPRGYARSVPALLDRLAETDFRPDVLVCHWISRFISSSDLARLAAELDVPVIWFLHDMAPFTGGCHYPLECTRYEDQCGNCIAIRSSRPDDISRRTVLQREKDLAGLTIVGVAHGRYIAGYAQRSRLFSARRVEKITPAIDTELYCPSPNRDAERARLGWPPGRPIILAGASLAEKRRKGGAFLAEALRMLGRSKMPPERRPVLALVGRTMGRGVYEEAGVRVLPMGYVDSSTMAAAYRAADVFVCPSLQETGPLMVGEALACGTPVVAFPVGICLDLVITGDTGYLASSHDARELAAGIEQVLSLAPDASEAMRQRCRRLAVERLHPDIHLRTFLRLCEDVSAQHRQSRSLTQSRG